MFYYEGVDCRRCRLHRHNAAIFLRRGFEVVAFDNLKRSTEYAINRLCISGIPIVKDDILNAVALRKALNGVGDRQLIRFSCY